LLLAVGSTFLALYQLALLRSMTALFNPYAAIFVMSFALVGLGIGGSLSAFALGKQKDELPERLSMLLGIMSIAAASSMTVPYMFPLGSKLSLFLMLCLDALPFACWGYGMGTCYRVMPSRSGPIYAANLLGVALGTSICFFAMKYLGGPIMAGRLASIALALAGFAAGRSRWNLSFALITFLFLAAAGRLTGWGTAPIPRWNSGRHQWGTELSRMVYNVGRVHRIGTVWNEENRTDLVGLRKGKDAIRWVFRDGALQSIMVGRPEEKGIQWYEKPFALIALPLKGVKPERLLAVGAGGGVEVRMAADSGVPHIRVIEPNRSMKPLFDRTGPFHGNLPGRKGGTFTYGDTLRTVQKEGKTFDLLFLPLREPGRIHWEGESVREDRTTTRRAFRLYRDRLSPGGVLAVLAPNEPLFVRALLTLNDICDADPASTTPWIGDHAWGFKLSDKLLKQGQGNGYNYLLMVSKGNPSDTLLDRIEDLAATLPVEPLFGPRLQTARTYQVVTHRPTPDDLQKYLTGMLQKKYHAPFDLPPATVDAPFFYQLTKRLDPFTRWGVGIGVFLMLGCFVFPLSSLRPLNAPGAESRPPIPLYLLYFAVLGTILPILEAAFGEIEKLILHHPNHAIILTRWIFLTGLAAGAVVRRKGRKQKETALILAALVLVGLAYGGSALIAREGSSGGNLPGAALLFFFPVAALMTGGLLGGIFPSGIRSLYKELPDLIPWAWGTFAAGASLAFASTQWLPRIYGWHRVWECIIGGLLILVVTGLLTWWQHSPIPQSSPHSPQTEG